MPLIDYEISLDFTQSKKRVISSAVGKIEFVISDTKRYVSVVTLSTKHNAKLLKQVQSGFRRTIN